MFGSRVFNRLLPLSASARSSRSTMLTLPFLPPGHHTATISYLTTRCVCVCVYTIYIYIYIHMYVSTAPCYTRSYIGVIIKTAHALYLSNRGIFNFDRSAENKKTARKNPREIFTYFAVSRV